MKNYMEDFEKAYQESTTNQGGSGGTYIQYAIKDMQQPHNIVRLIGAPKFFMRAWIVTDNEKKFPIIFSKDSIFQRIVNKVLEFKWVKSPPGSQSENEKEYVNQDKYPDIFWMVKQNSSRDMRERGWQGSSQYAFNCIDRHDTWCRDNRHTKLLAKSQYDLGISWTAFNALKNDVVSDYGPYQGYDINFKRIVDERGDVSYTAHKADRMLHEIGLLVTEGPLSPEEEQYEPYDLDTLSKNTKSSLLLKHLRQKISRIDQILKTTFIRDLETQAERETEEDKLNPPVQTQQPQQPVHIIYQQPQPIQQKQSYQQPQQTYQQPKPIQQPYPQPQPIQQPQQSKPVYQQPHPAQQQPVQYQQPIQQAYQQPYPVQQPHPIQQPYPQPQPVQQSYQPHPAPIQPIQQQSAMLPCAKCGVEFPMDENKCPHCGYEEAM